MSTAGQVVRGAVRWPARFVSWVYRPAIRDRPGRGELITHRHASQWNADTTKWSRSEARKRDHDAEVRQAARDAEDPAGRSTRGPGRSGAA